jgi:hypothetical protein
MIVKPWTERSQDIAALTRLIESGNLPDTTLKRAQIQLMKLKAGTQGEKAAAYEIARLYGNDPDYAVIHDLRIEMDGQVAQIDHLIINRSLHGLLLETKNFSEGLGCNEHGEWVGFYHHKPFGIASPILQAKRQKDILDRFLQPGHPWIPKRVGEYIGLRTTPFVLISNTARISRPRKPVDGMDTVFKIEALGARAKAFEDSLGFVVKKLRQISQDQLYAYAEGLAAQHTPHTIDWAAYFGIGAPLDVTEHPEPGFSVSYASTEGYKPKKKKLICDTCKEKITLAEGRFCWTRKDRFGEGVYCRTCQSAF